ncbi:SCP2 sterol-binding domain-containing protein [Pseudomonas sp.]|uniref:ubiquinone biosynthesis accessory factor UbiJ n=1 Tax=Pseudomonas sp. TaxID=306 RepID=UPI0028AE6858|nr:SCP2 sterol-binding domain-containing protein [Pseudomonas sp.]
MITQALLAAAESGINRILALDATAQARLAGLSGKVIEIDCAAPAVRLFILPNADGLRLARQWAAPADCVLRAPASTLLRLASSRQKTAVLHRPDVQIDGDSGVLMELSAVLQDLELDWEYELSRWLGPLAGNFLGSRLRSASQWAEQSIDSLRLDLQDYLAEETGSLVGSQEAEARFAELDELKLALDRLEARVERLAQGSKPQA